MLTVSNLHAAYGSITALHGVDLEVNRKEIVALVGSNGAGKTTTLRVISGLVKGSSGTVSFNGEKINNLPSHRIVKLGIGHSPEARRVWPKMTVEENLQMGAFIRKNSKEIRETLTYIYELMPRLIERRKQLAGTLSGGEQQMLAIGRALMSRPKLLLLDEPSMGLAPLFVEKVAEIIIDLQREGNTILLVEQNAFMALNIANRAYVLENGQTTKSGLAGDLLKDSYVQKAYLGI